MLLRFEDLCDRPAETVDRIAAFAGVEIDEDFREAAAALLRKPTSVGRYRGRPLEAFPEAERRALARYGHPID